MRDCCVQVSEIVQVCECASVQVCRLYLSAWLLFINFERRLLFRDPSCGEIISERLFVSLLVFDFDFYFIQGEFFFCVQMSQHELKNC